MAAKRWELEVPADWVFEDEGYSGATLVRPGLERLRDLAAQVPVDVVLCYSPDRLTRCYAYQALLIDEFARAGTEIRFVKGPRAETPEDELLIQFQGLIAEYERAQIAERTRRGKTDRARAGVINRSMLRTPPTSGGPPTRGPGGSTAAHPQSRRPAPRTSRVPPRPDATPPDRGPHRNRRARHHRRGHTVIEQTG